MVPTISLLSAFALVVSVGAASAENTFRLDRDHSTADTLTLTDVQADQPGTVQVWAYNEHGRIGRLLGWTQVGAGFIGDVAVPLNQPPTAPFLIRLSNGNYAPAFLRVRKPLIILQPVTD